MLPVVVDVQSDRPAARAPETRNAPAPREPANGSIQLQHGNTSVRIEGVSDVVDVTWQHLKKATRPLCYLRSLLASPVDFAHQVRARQAAAADAGRKQHVATVFRETPVRCAGGVFFDARAERRIVIDEGAPR